MAVIDMTRADIHKAITDYLSIFDGNGESPETRKERLVIALDRLALAYHFSAWDFDAADYPDAPKSDFHDFRDVTVSLFPDLGYYNIATDNSVNIGQTTLGVGNAVNDVAEIADDMLEVKWLWENTSVENALWQFRWGYENHWGAHLRYLQLYLLELGRGT